MHGWFIRFRQSSARTWPASVIHLVPQTHRTDGDARCRAVNALLTDGFSHYCRALFSALAESLKCLPSYIYQILGALPGEVHLPWLLLQIHIF